MVNDVFYSSPERERIKSLIIAQFEANVQGRSPDITGYNLAHDGAEGDWLTKQMGLTVNGRNEPDFHGFEMKKDSKGKTTFGDWPPDFAIYKGTHRQFDQDTFLSIFGSANPKKGHRYSWSGTVFPKIGVFNDYGQGLFINVRKDIEAIYRHSLNIVESSRHRMPEGFHGDDVTLARWTFDNLKLRLERKFNQLGWFRCLKDHSGVYDKIQFGYPINIQVFMELFEKGLVFIDCGMHQGNPRPYMTFRANNNIWESLAERTSD